MTGQFIRSADPDVVSAVERNREGRIALNAKAFEWAKERGSEVVMMSGFAGRIYVTGLPSQPEGFGRWTKPQRGSSHPFKDNAKELRIMADLRFDQEEVPGLPSAVHSTSDRQSGVSYLMYPTPFVADGFAWVAYSHQIDPSDSDKFGEQWSECLASEYYAAKGE